MLTIRQIDQRDYPTGKKAMYKYQSDKYYEVQIEKVEMGWSLSLNEKSFTTPFVKELEGGIFEPYKEGSEVYVADFNGEEAAVMVVQKMEWNNTLLIHDIYVDSRLKNKGIGSKLIGVAKKRANELGVRAITLETQTSNYPAIQFYMKHGFELVGFNTISYTNEDVQNNEVRIEMACIVEKSST